MLNGEADRRESCSLLELSHPNTQQLQFEHEQTQTNKDLFINRNPKSNVKITKNKLRINFCTSNCLTSTVLIWLFGFKSSD